MNTSHCPEILAPAGDQQSFLAALAAGADAIYVGLKHFSARMQAGNFSISELAALTELARTKDCKVYVAFNSLVKPGDVESAARLVDRLVRYVNPAALIVQDLSLIQLARQADFKGEIHLSTLSNVSHPTPLADIHERLGVSRVVLPRELSVDEVRTCAQACPQGLDLEVFVHGALCYNISGRCYWSSFMGGKSGLRGRCVQPCRRLYAQKNRRERFFSCSDLSLDVLVKALLALPQVKTWKIEGRKKGPHYVYYTVSAYRLLRDNINDPEAKKTALGLLEQALGRKGSHYSFLPQRAFSPTEVGGQTGSGLLVAKTTSDHSRKMSLHPRQELIKGDRLRVGYQDEPGHQIVHVNRSVPKGGQLNITAKGRPPKSGTPVFLIDRREPELTRAIKALEREMEALPAIKTGASEMTVSLPKKSGKSKTRPMVMNLNRRAPKALARGLQSAQWLAPASQLGGAGRHWWWLPPVIWPEEEAQWKAIIAKARKAGARQFMLGSPWQASLFHRPTGAGKRGKGSRPLELWAGPFCNISNGLALQALSKLGISGAVVSPELSGDDYFALAKQSALPIGFVSYGLWPLGITRIPAGEIKPEKPMKSPKGEICWTRRYGPNNWIYPNWNIDLRNKERDLGGAGYSMFVHIFESIPREIGRAPRASTFNWDLTLL